MIATSGRLSTSSSTRSWRLGSSSHYPTSSHETTYTVALSPGLHKVIATVIAYFSSVGLAADMRGNCCCPWDRKRTRKVAVYCLWANLLGTTPTVVAKKDPYLRTSRQYKVRIGHPLQMSFNKMRQWKETWLSQKRTLNWFIALCRAITAWNRNQKNPRALPAHTMTRKSMMTKRTCRSRWETWKTIVTSPWTSLKTTEAKLMKMKLSADACKQSSSDPSMKKTQTRKTSPTRMLAHHLCEERRRKESDRIIQWEVWEGKPP